MPMTLERPTGRESKRGEGEVKGEGLKRLASRVPKTPMMLEKETGREPRMQQAEGRGGGGR